MRTLSAALIALAVLASSASGQTSAPIDVHTTAGDPGAIRVAAMTETGRQTVEAWFGKPFPEIIHLTVAPDRAAFNAAFPVAWGMSQTECWMVGVGVADFLVLLSPADWPKDACDHKANDEAELQGIITHELTHTYHGQMNPSRDFTGMDDLDWLVEGLAVVVSGQLTHDRLAAACDEVKANGGPATLADVWAGPTRYGLAGSLVRYVEVTYGRATVADLLPMTKREAVLVRLGVTEDQLLTNWKAWLVTQ